MASAGISRSVLRDILTTHIGLDPETIDGAGGASLADLGVDSIGFIELQKAVEEQYGTELPDDAQAWSLDGILDHLNSSLRRAS
uniref:Lcz26 n=1 Tax=Streptomyces sanglieri TaxID=193460 RepID=B0LJ43_9ACTN|nr:Lcz26 [Streptomyces sanglieri]